MYHGQFTCECAIFLLEEQCARSTLCPIPEHHRHCLPWFDGNAVGNTAWRRPRKHSLTPKGGFTAHLDVQQLLFITQHEVNIGNTFLPNNMQHHPTYIGVRKNLLTTITQEDELAEWETECAPPPGMRSNSFRFMFSEYVKEVSIVPSECLQNWTMSTVASLMLLNQLTCTHSL